MTGRRSHSRGRRPDGENFEDVPLTELNPAATRPVSERPQSMYTTGHDEHFVDPSYNPMNYINTDYDNNYSNSLPPPANSEFRHTPLPYPDGDIVAPRNPLPFPTNDRLMAPSQAPDILPYPTNDSLIPREPHQNPHRHSYLLYGNDDAAVEATAIPSAIFQERDQIDLVQGLRDILGAREGSRGGWLSKNPQSIPQPTRNSLIDADGHAIIYDGDARSIEDSGDRAVARYSRSMHSAASDDNFNPPSSSSPRKSSSSVVRHRHTRSGVNPQQLEEGSHDITQLQLEPPPLRPSSPASSRNALAEAVKKFSTRIVTGGTAPPAATQGTVDHALSPSLRPVSIRRSRDDFDDEYSGALIRPSISSTSEIPPISAVSGPIHPTTSSTSLQVSQFISPSPSLNSYDTSGTASTGYGQLSAGIINDLTLSEQVSRADGEPESEYLNQPPPRPPKIVLFGKSLGIFSKDNKFRRFLYDTLTKKWFEILFLVVLVAQVFVLTAMTIPDIVTEGVDQRPIGFMTAFHDVAYDWILLGIFIFYTIVAIAKSIAFGLLFDFKNHSVRFSYNHKEYTIISVKEDTGPIFHTTDLRKSLSKKNRRKNPQHTQFESTAGLVPTESNQLSQEQSPPIQREFRRAHHIDPDKEDTIPAPERAYLRSTWTRIDFVAIICYWITFGLQANNIATRLELFVFRCLSGLPMLRLLNMTKRTSMILHSLKVGAPRIWTIFLFIGFFWTLFSIIGSQSFHGSLSRTCLWINPDNSSDTYNNEFVFCGSYIDSTTFERVAFIQSDGTQFSTPKGYTCPVYSVCLQQENPYNGTVSFDNIFNSLELVFVVLSLNTFSDLMYYLVDSEHLMASIYFVFGIIILAYGLASLFISIIALTFKVGTAEINDTEDAETKMSKFIKRRNRHIRHMCRSLIGRTYHYLREIPILIIFADLIVQSTVSYKASESHISGVYSWQIFVAAFLLFEVVLRMVIYLPEILFFFTSWLNCLDLFLAIANIIIILPFVHRREVLYAWLNVFQVVRFYRCTIAIRFIRDLWMRVLLQARLILDVTIFYYVFIYLASILGCLLLQGVIPPEENGGGSMFTFQTLANSFLAMYIISTTENWTAISYNAVVFTESLFSRIFVASFFIAWFIVSNFVTLNMFIAVLSENLELSVSAKEMEQVYIFFKQELRRQSGESIEQTKHGLKYFLRFLTPRSQQPENDKAMFEKVVDMLKDSGLDNFLGSHNGTNADLSDPALIQTDGNRVTTKSDKVKLEDHKSLLSTIVSPIVKLQKRLRKGNNESYEFSSPEQYISYMRERQQEEVDQIRNDPNYNKSLRIFSVDNKLRRLCQRIVPPGYGTRLEGQTEPTIFWNIFWGFMLAATIGLIVIAVIVTPIYYKQYLTYTRMNWYVITEAAFLGVFTLELVIKLIADGFFFAPNAYLRQVWGVIDFFVWATLVANLIQEIFLRDVSSRVIRAFKALRALRLLTVNFRAQELFHSIIIVGIWKLFSAALIALSLLYPFSVWGLNLFRGKMFSCNDSGFSGPLEKCVGEFASSPFNWDVLAPRAITKSYYDFDTFGHSFLILFEIISLEGWVDVLVSAMSITGKFNQPEFRSSNFYGAFVILYNTISTIFILTLFLSVVIQNYAKSSGNAYFTDAQRMWYEIEKSIRTTRPSIRPPGLIEGTFRARLFHKFVNNHSWVHVSMFLSLVGISVVLMSEWYPLTPHARGVQWSFLTTFLVNYLIMISLKCYAFGPKQYFRRRWDLYAFVVTIFSFLLKTVGFAFDSEFYTFQILEKLFYVGMLLLMIPYSQRLGQLLKTAAASIPNMFHLLLVWAVLYFMFGIAMNQVFGMTRIGENGSTVINFRSLPNALVLLFRMSCGEGWNQIMADYTVEYPNCYVYGQDTDCGSQTYAYILFISWNIISMYIFTNLLVSLIFEQFAYLARPSEPQINRDKIRDFKAAWIVFDPTARGFIEVRDLRAFLGSLEGYFSTRIHTEPWTVRSILQDSGSVNEGKVDVPTLRKYLKGYPWQEVAMRRAKSEQFYEHAFELQDEQGRISFHSLLLLFPFYNDMGATQCLNLRDYLHYQNILKRIKERQRAEREAGLREMVKEMLRVQVLRIHRRKEEYTRQTGVPMPTLRIGFPGSSPASPRSPQGGTYMDNSTTLVDPSYD